MNDEAVKLLRELRLDLASVQDSPRAEVMIAKIDALLAQSKAAPDEQKTEVDFGPCSYPIGMTTCGYPRSAQMHIGSLGKTPPAGKHEYQPEPQPEPKAAPQGQPTQLTSGSIAKTTPAIPASAAPDSGEGMVEVPVTELKLLRDQVYELRNKLREMHDLLSAAPSAGREEGR